MEDPLFEEVYFPELGSEIAVISVPLASSILPDNPEVEDIRGEPHSDDLLNYILDDEIDRGGTVSNSIELSEEDLHQKTTNKFQIRIKPQKRRRHSKRRKEDSQSDTRNNEERVINKVNRPRGRPRIYHCPEDRPNYYYAKKDKVAPKIFGEREKKKKEKTSALKVKNKDRDKLRRDSMKTSLSTIKMAVPGLNKKTDKVTAIENASQYALYLKKQVGEFYDREFLEVLKSDTSWEIMN